MTLSPPPPKDTREDDSSVIEEFQAPYGGVSLQFLEEIKGYLETKNHKALQSSLEGLHAADAADLLERLDPEKRHRILSQLKHPLDPAALSHLSEDVRDDVVEVLGPKALAEAVSGLESDDAVHLIEDLDEEQKSAVLKAVSAEDRALLEESLTYPEDSAGRLMQREIVFVPLVFTVAQALKHIHSNALELPEEFYNVYVTDERHHPVGVIGLSRLLRCDPKKTVEEVMDEALHKIPVELDQEEVAQLFQHYGLVSAPVVSKDGRMVGRITLDDVVDVIKEEAEEDILRLSRVGEADFYADTLETFYRRSPWLLVTLINALVTIFVIGQFETSIESVTEIAFFLPVAAMMGGNSGLQVVTVIVRALTTHELRQGNILRAVRKEVLVGIINGVVFALLLGATAGVLEQSPLLGVVVGGALICNMIWAGLMGSLLPIFINRFGADPAIGAGPMLAIMTDVAGYAIYLLLATMFLL
ncbi:MAG: magnesium transporter [bacterium]|nr:magnesium transporter [bacterium]